MESLTKVCSGSRDIAIGISGFGSARVGRERWLELGALTGRTTYYLQYDAQDFPDSFEVSLSTYSYMMNLWSSARSSALSSSEYLSVWIEKMVSSGRKVLLVGFSLGAFVAWSAVQRLPDDVRGHVDVVFLSGALADRPESWSGIDSVHQLVNVYSRSDLVLRYLYPQAVKSDESPAAGLGPLCVSAPHVINLDVTDMMGSDHLWGSSNLHRLIAMSVPLVSSSLAVPALPLDSSLKPTSPYLSSLSVQRLWRWTFVEPDLHRVFIGALDGVDDFVSFMADVDAWSLEGSRLSLLVEISSMSVDLQSCRVTGPASRSLDMIRGMLRSWMSTDSRLLRRRAETTAFSVP